MMMMINENKIVLSLLITLYGIALYVLKPNKMPNNPHYVRALHKG